MSTAFSNALAGLNADNVAINTVSGNLANLSTTGYQNQQVSFDDLLSGNVEGQSTTSVAGSVVAQATTEFTQGSIETTSQPYDAAIQGSGFFVLSNSSNQIAYTRDGGFTVDAQGNLLGTGGENVQGWNAVNGVLNTTGATSNIRLPVSGSEPPVATTAFSISANLNANAPVGSQNATFSSPLQIYDAEGTAHTLTVTYTETAANTWSYNVTLPSADIAGGTGTNTTVASGSLTFDGQGNLITPNLAANPIKVPITGLGDGASDMNLKWNLYNPDGTPMITQFNEPSANLANSQNGVAPGQLTGTSIGANGQITAKYSNGSSVVVAQLALASILNPSSMQNIGNNTFAVTAATATPTVGVSGVGSLGQITGGALESSTVDIATEFTNLLTYERGYQANSKVITTEDDITQSTVNLIQG